MSAWDLDRTKDHLENLYREAQAARQVRLLRSSARPSLLPRLLVRFADVLVFCGSWLKARYQASSTPAKSIILDLD